MERNTTDVGYLEYTENGDTAESSSDYVVSIFKRLASIKAVVHWQAEVFA